MSVYEFWYLNCTISFESYITNIIVMRVGNQKATISNNVSAIEQICVLNPVK